jgi:hypothetical protein
MMPPIAKIDSTARRSYPYGRAEAEATILPGPGPQF